MVNYRGEAKIGVENLEFAQLNDAGFVVGETVKLPGTTQIKTSISSENATLSADNGPYLSLSSGIEKVTETINNYFITPEVKRLMLGVQYALGTEIYGEKTLPNPVASLYSSKLAKSGKNVWVACLEGRFKFPSGESKTLGSGAPDPATEEVEGEFIMKPVGDTKQIMLIGYESDPDFDLATFRSLVFPKNDSELTAAWAKVKAKLNPSS